MKNALRFSLIMALLMGVATPSIQGMQAISQVSQLGKQGLESAKRFVACLAGKSQCDKSEITRARLWAAGVSAALFIAVAALIGISQRNAQKIKSEQAQDTYIAKGYSGKEEWEKLRILIDLYKLGKDLEYFSWDKNSKIPTKEKAIKALEAKGWSQEKQKLIDKIDEEIKKFTIKGVKYIPNDIFIDFMRAKANLGNENSIDMLKKVLIDLADHEHKTKQEEMKEKERLRLGEKKKQTKQAELDNKILSKKIPMYNIYPESIDYTNEALTIHIDGKTYTHPTSSITKDTPANLEEWNKITGTLRMGRVSSDRYYIKVNPSDIPWLIGGGNTATIGELIKYHYW